MIVMETSMGTIKVQLDEENTPVTAKNFLAYVKSGHYDGTIFHRVIKSFMVQGGGFKPGMSETKTNDPIMNEADKGKSNARGTLAMARTTDPNSATAQFFINVVDNKFLDHKAKTPDGWGYCVFGEVVEGMDIVDKIREVSTTSQMSHQDVPSDDVVIKSATLVEE